ncbi:MAG: hypothetical protein Q9195_004494 [Heterodermia aff. obscurata]
MADPMLCPVDSDRLFGPRVDVRCRSFDFTLAFEDTVLCGLAPAIVARPQVQVSNESIMKTALSLLFGAQLAFLVVQTASPKLHTPASLASSIIILAASTGAPFLSYIEHKYSVRPSSLLTLYLFASAVTAAPKLRTLWLSPGLTTAATLWTVAVSITVIACFLESITKTKHLEISCNDATKEQTSNFWGRGFYIWTLPLFHRGYSTILLLADIPTVDKSLSGSFALERLSSTWARFEHPSQVSSNGHASWRRQGQHTMFRAAVMAFFWPFCSAIIPRLCLTVFTFSQTFLITATIEFVETPTTPETQHYGQALVGAYVLVTDSSSAAILAMLRVSALSNQSQKLWVERVEERLHLTSKTLGDMKVVKMLGLSETLSRIIERSRQAEIKTSIKLRRLLVWQIFLCMYSDFLANYSRHGRIYANTVTPANIPVDLAPFATFAVFTVVAAVKKSGSLLTASAFTSLALISLLTNPLLNFILAVPSLVQCLGCFQRIQEYCRLNSDMDTTDNDIVVRASNSDRPTASGSGMELSSLPADSPASEVLVTFRNASFGWGKGLDPVLKQLCLHICKGKIIMVTGPVGSGKSTLIQSLLGETTLLGGQLVGQSLPSAYCSQEPWIMNDTIRNNVILSSLFDEKWYDYVMRVCGVHDEFKSASRNGQLYAGSKGTTLSGGQKQRVVHLPSYLLQSEALARAIYSRSPFVLLDDVFSGLDAQTIRFLSESLFSPDGYFRRYKVTVVFATHSRMPFFKVFTYNLLSSIAGSILPFADQIVRLKSGMKVNNLDLQSFESAYDNGTEETATKPEPDALKKAKTSLGSEQTNTNSTPEGESNDSEASGSWRKEGDWSVYGYYIRNAGVPSCALFLTFIFIASFSTNFPKAANCTVKLIILCVVARYLAAIVPFLGATIYIIQRCYLHTSRQLRLLDIEAKAPLYTHFLETIGGIATIRAYTAQSHFNKITIALLNESQKPVYMLYCVQQWLTLVLDLTVGAVAVVLVAITVSLKSSFSASSVGVALTTILTFNQALTSLIKYWTLLETSIGAVSRIKNFVEKTPAEEHAAAAHVTPNNWPSQGAIQFQNISVAHSPNTAPAIKDLSLSIARGEKVAICGRSGSGKTTLILSLLQMKYLQSGSIKLDGIDLSTLHPDVVRARINTIPQDPFFAPGSIRFNMDPGEAYTDMDVETVIRRVGLWGKVQDNGGLASTASMEHWSAGQQQLLALARALMSKSMVLVLDEAMSRCVELMRSICPCERGSLTVSSNSVDHDTETLMQEVIDTEFAHQTVISVIHRLDYLEHYDRVVLLDDGVLVECDKPSVLLARDSEVKRMFHSRKTEDERPPSAVNRPSLHL